PFGTRRQRQMCIRDSYPPHSYAAMTLGNVPVYPSQLFLSVAMLVVFLMLWRLDRRVLTVGVLFGIYLVGQGIVRYLVDFTRYYEDVDRLPALAPVIGTKSQAIALFLALAGAVLVVQRLRAGHRATDLARPAREAGR
ncbi:MAG: prolipoprotein diacylglyceryl transferase, partial [Candidatus Eisenbacteria bacterium]|nr:prolipoprotein diacylglyceryl transferase [Candidatus Eisenbacteria bacterium]